MSDNPLVGKECRYIVHLPEIKDVRDDTHYIKEILHYKDGTTKPNIKLFKNFKREFYITKPFFRNHEDKRETESIDNLDRFTSTQSQLANSVASKIGKTAYFRNNIRDVRDSPYVYGIDINSTTMIKQLYLEKFKDFNTPNSVAAYDIETDIDRGNVTIISVVMEDKIWTGILKSVADGDNMDKRLKYLYDKYIPDVDIKKDMQVEYEVIEDELELIKKSFKVANEWKPDFLAIWNIEFDIKYIMGRLKMFNVDPKEVICDQTLPKELRHFKYREGSKQKLTESGKFTPINNHEQWHTVECTSTFFIIDAMLAYHQIRVGRAQLPGGYSLDNVLNTNLKLGKLKFDGEIAEHLKGAEWHQYMLNKEILKYTIYNQWDVMSMIKLDHHTKDLSHSISLLAGVSDLFVFNSGPKKIIDAMYFFFRTKGRILGSRPSKVEDHKLLGLEKWINNNKEIKLNNKILKQYHGSQ